MVMLTFCTVMPPIHHLLKDQLQLEKVFQPGLKFLDWNLARSYLKIKL